MPTVLRKNGFRFFFFSNDRGEPPHVHVESAEKYAKFWLEPVSLAGSSNFRGPELTELTRMIIEQADLFKERWYEFFDR